MLIKRLELENIKSYENASYEFDEGVIAIIGENGAGKTTIIESIAWALFDVLEYKKEDFVRRGQKRGIVRVVFVSPTDEREYVVQRDTNNQYEIYDPQSKIRLRQGKSEVISFLQKEFGVSNVNLEAFFRCAIGVPQGTFTADFLRSPAERKPIFDKLLRVEEYKKASEKLLSAQKYGEERKGNISEEISRMEGEVKYLQTYEEKIGEVKNNIQKLSEELRILEKEIQEKSEVAKNLGDLEEKFNQLENALREATSQKQTQEGILKQKQRELEDAKFALEKIKEVESDYRRHLEVREELKKLENKRNEQNKLKQEKNSLELQLSGLKSELNRFKEDLEKAKQASARVEELKLLVPKQEELEKKLQELQSELHSKKRLQEQLSKLDKELSLLTKEYEEKEKQAQELEKQIQSATALSATDLNSLRTHLDQLTEQISYLQARLKAEEDFREKIKDGLCPILAQRCLNIGEGETLEGFITRETNNLAKELESLKRKRQIFQEAEKKKSQLESLKAEIEKIVEEGKKLKSEREDLNQEIEKIESLTSDISKIEQELKTLENPKAQIKLLEAEIAKGKQIEQKIVNAEKEIYQLSQKIEALKTQIELFGDVETQFDKLSKDRDATLSAYEQYLRYEKTSRLLSDIEKEVEKIIETIKDLDNQRSKWEKDLESICKRYDKQQHEAIKKQLQSLEIDKATKKTELENFQRELDTCNKQIKRLEEIRKQMQEKLEEKQRLEKVIETTQFIREILRDSGPLIVKNIISQISNEANRIFQEIMDNAEATLEWTEDYSILLEERGYKRPFVCLSGGEQMAAALAVRLAFLLQLSDIRIAFFDEPTMNMDQIRCEKLAQQIEKINSKKYFKQIFVISHDSTFESLVDKPIYIKKTRNMM